MKHYYTDEGVLNHEWKDRELLVQLANFSPKAKNDCAEACRRHVRSLVMEQVGELLYDYDLRKSLGSLGGGKTVEEWREERESSPMKTILKKLMFEFIDEGYVPQEFFHAAWGAICEVQIYWALSGME